MPKHPSLSACTCDFPEDVLEYGGQHYHDPDCPLVSCDTDCGALKDPDPQDTPELLKALEHWRRHRLYAGCSHGH